MDKSLNYAVIVAAGSGTRMGAAVKKQYLSLAGIPVLSRTIQTFDLPDLLEKIVLVIPEKDREQCMKEVIGPFDFKTPVELAAGGETRQASVRNGLKKIRSFPSQGSGAIVLIHDGVRPFVSPQVINACIEKAKQTGACIPGLPLADTVKKIRSDADSMQDVLIEKTVDRQRLYCAQTPQTFSLDLLWDAFEYAAESGFEATDDASVVEHFQHPVSVVPGSRFNIKLTMPEDLVLGELFAAPGALEK